MRSAHGGVGTTGSIPIDSSKHKVKKHLFIMFLCTVVLGLECKQHSAWFH